MADRYIVNAWCLMSVLKNNISRICHHYNKVKWVLGSVKIEEANWIIVYDKLAHNMISPINYLNIYFFTANKQTEMCLFNNMLLWQCYIQQCHKQQILTYSVKSYLNRRARKFRKCFSYSASSSFICVLRNANKELSAWNI